MRSNTFELTEVELAGTTEQVLRGGRHLFPKLPDALHGVHRIGVIGWGPQARAQAMNLRESLEGSGIDVAVGLRRRSTSRPDARAAGFTEDTDTLGEVGDIVRSSDLALFLVSDAALAEQHAELLGALRPGATAGLSHGFLLGHLRASGGMLPRHISVIGVCPKGMGASVRRLYEQGRTIDGAGINASIAVEQDLDGWSTDRALAWAVGIGAPYVFETTLESEYLSDIAGERAVLLGVPHAIAESVFRRRRELGDAETRAFEVASETLTGPLARVISKEGIRGVIDRFAGDDRRHFEDVYCAAYPAMATLFAEVYDDVESGAEIASVRRAAARLARHPMHDIDGSRMWRVGADVRRARIDAAEPTIDAEVAGLFLAALVAQIDELAAHGHPWSEIANESVIEVVDSLLPYMHARGIAHMVDSCSITARLGARKWGPRFEAAITQQIFTALDGIGRHDDALVAALESHPIHGVLATIGAYRPSVDVSVDVA